MINATMAPRRSELLRRVDALHRVEPGTRRWLPRTCPTALAAEVERQATRVLRRQPEPQRSHLLEIARRAATWAASREPSDAVSATFGVEIALASLLGTTTDDEPPAAWRHGHPVSGWESRQPIYPRPTRTVLRRRVADLARLGGDMVTADVERHVQATRGSASVEHYADAVRPPLDALAVAAAWLPLEAPTIAAIELGGQAPREALSVMMPGRRVAVTSTIWEAESGPHARAAVVNIPGKRAYAWHRALAQADELPTSVRHVLGQLNREQSHEHETRILDLLDRQLKQGGRVVVMADPDGGGHHRVLAQLLARGYLSVPAHWVDTVESPTWVPLVHRPWSPVRGPTATGRLISMLRRRP